MPEQRIHTRLKYDTDVELVTADKSRYSGHMINVSRGGTLVKIEPQLAYGDNVTLIFSLPGITEKCEIPCIVRWIKPEHGTGLQFKHLRPIEVWALNKLMHSLADEQD